MSSERVVAVYPVAILRALFCVRWSFSMQEIQSLNSLSFCVICVLLEGHTVVVCNSKDFWGAVKGKRGFVECKV